MVTKGTCSEETWLKLCLCWSRSCFLRAAVSSCCLYSTHYYYIMEDYSQKGGCILDVVCLKNSDCWQRLVKASGLVRYFYNGHLSSSVMWYKVIFSSCTQFLLVVSIAYTVIPCAALIHSSGPVPGCCSVATAGDCAAKELWLFFVQSGQKPVCWALSASAACSCLRRHSSEALDGLHCKGRVLKCQWKPSQMFLWFEKQYFQSNVPLLFVIQCVKKDADPVPGRQSIHTERTPWILWGSEETQGSRRKERSRRKTPHSPLSPLPCWEGSSRLW